MSWLFGNRNKKQEEAEWIVGLPETVEDDPRIGLPATAYNGFSGTIESVHRFKDGAEMFSIENNGYGNGGLTSDQITIHKP